MSVANSNKCQYKLSSNKKKKEKEMVNIRCSNENKKILINIFGKTELIKEINTKIVS